MSSNLKRALPAVLVVGLLVAGGIIALGRLMEDGESGPSPERLALGRQVYGEQCAACHGAELEGQPNWRQRGADGLLPGPPHDATGHTWHHPDEQLFFITKYGTAALAGADYKTAMIGFGEVLGDEEIGAVLDFIKSRWPPDIRRRQADITARARKGN
ncbi:MAG: cytochrome c [Kiloniellales bacterium]